METWFHDRRDAGQRLAARLQGLAGEKPVVLALPRGGVPVAFEIAQALGAPLEVLVCRKLGVPGHRELGFGALCEGGVRYLDPGVVTELGLTAGDIEGVIRIEAAELERRVVRYRGGRPPPSLAGRTAVIVDDGVAMGGTMRAAIEGARRLGADRVVVAVGVAPPRTLAALESVADEVVAQIAPYEMGAIGLYFEDFHQVSDAEVLELLGQSTGTAGS